MTGTVTIMATATIAYRRPSRLGDGRLELQTAGGFADGMPARHPLFFAGMLTAPRPFAAGLIALAGLAATDYRHRTHDNAAHHHRTQDNAAIHHHLAGDSPAGRHNAGRDNAAGHQHHTNNAAIDGHHGTGDTTAVNSRQHDDDPAAAHDGYRTGNAATNRYHHTGDHSGTPPDPIVTSGDGRIRVEALSACGGVYGRLDLLGGALDGETYALGSAGLDLNRELCAALAGSALAGPLHLSVGPDAVTAAGGWESRRPTAAEPRREHRDPRAAGGSPGRWVRSLIAAGTIGAALAPRAELDGATAAAMLHRLPAHGGRDVRWLVPAGRSMRMAGSAAAGGVCLAGAFRLAALAPLLPMVRALRVYAGPAAPGSGPLPAAWVLDLGRARFSLLLSGGLDRALGDETHTDAGPGDRDVVRHGFDWAEAAWFRRDIPYRPVVA